MPTINTSMTAKEWLMLVTLSILWGGSFFFVGVLVDDLPPLTIVALRVGLAAIALHLILMVQGDPIKGGWPVWRAFFVMGFLNNLIPFTLIVWGQGHIASGLAAILNAMTPIFTVVVAHVLLADERLSPRKVIGVVVGFIGVAVMVGPELLDGLGTNVWAQLAILGAALSYAFAGTYGRRFHTLGVKPLHTATGQVTASTVMLIPLSAFVDQPWGLEMPGLEAWAAMLGLAVISTALAYILYFRVLATAGATNVLLVTLLVPVSAILLGVAFLGESLETDAMIGMGLIAVGLLVIDGRLIRRSQPAPRAPD
ncbi:DMT family transporter [Magnetovibrio sp. PR-2]|uniref:DMT family transporter n=1 Tax=Magnetovibrio sp. PR-2 TaxID=3120356 RepID=UPI002FCE34B0